MKRSLLFLCCILVLLVPVITGAADLTPERSLQQSFSKSRILLARIERAMLAGAAYSGPLAELKGLGASIRTDHQVLLARLDARGDDLEELGGDGASRHAAVRERYVQAVSRYLDGLAALPEQQVTLAAVRELRAIVAEILPEKKLPIHGSVPYRHLNLPARTPKADPVIIPAYRGGETDFAGADLEASPEAPISLAIAELAESLEWNPVAMYEWVKNNIQTEWYWGAMKGAEETLRQKSGNDADQATLLVALFRSAGFPARFVRGVMEFADIESAREQTGLDDPLEIGRLLQKAGIPYAPVVSGGRLSNFRIEHVWAEVRIPYANYRGALLDEHGQTWLALDTSIKVAGYAQNDPGDTVQALDFTAIRDDYLAGPGTETPLQYLAAQLDAQLARTDPGLSYASLLRTRTLNPEQMQIIPAGLQFTEVAITGEYASLPEDLLHQARFIARAGEVIFFDQPLPIYKLSNRSIAVRFEPETIEDQEIINAYGGLDNTPSYLIRLRPVLSVAGKRELVGQGGLAAGSEFSLAVELVAPAATVRTENSLIAGYPTQIGLCAQQAIAPSPIPLAQKNGERLLFERAVSYLDQGNRAEAELSSLLQLQLARPLPTLVTLGGVLDVVSLLDAPHGFTWQGLYLDADLRVAEPVGGLAPAGATPASLFMQLAGLQHSSLEHRIFEEGFGVEAVSTAKLFALARAQNIPLTQIDATNIVTLLPTLNLPASIAADISNAVHQGYHVTLPESELIHEDWTGYAYLQEHPATSESGWMLAGEIAGGMTALNPERWPEEYREIMTHPGTDSSGDPASAVEIKVIRGLDSLTGTAGEQLKTPLQIIALDAAGKPVRGVEVRFAVKAGGARVSRRYFASWQQDLLVQTDYDGIARVDVLFNQSTDINPTTARRSTDKASQRVDETVIEVTTTSGLRTAAPASVFGFPDAPHHLQVTGGNTSGPILTWATTLIAVVEDQYNNQRSGEQVEFVMGAARSGSACGSETSTRPGLLIGAEDPCVGNIPVYGQCGSTSVTGTTGLHLGAAAHVLLGDRPAAEYPVTIKSGALSEQVMVTSSPAGPCDPEDAPYSALVLRVIHDTDAQGNIISAGPVSTPGNATTVPLLARLYAIQEQGAEVDKEIPCLPNGIDTCPVWQGTGVYEIATDFVTASVSFDGTAAEPLGNGLYRVSYPLATAPKKHEINVTGNATDKEKINVHVCDDRNDCQLVEEDKPIDPVSHSATAYAVAVTVPQEQHIIPVNEEGYVTADYPLEYTIAPPEYIAATTDVVLSEKNNDGAFAEIAYFGAETSGQGGMTFLTGFRFDQNKKYQAQVVLNEGSESMEIRSKAMSLQPLTLELDADLNRDGVWKEDDPLEHTAPGLIIPLNLDDDDRDGVVDYLDGYNLDPASPEDDSFMDPAAPELTDNELIPIKLHGLPADFAEGTVTLEIIEGQGKIRVLADNKKENGVASILIDTIDPDATTGTLSGNSYEWKIGSTETPTMQDLPSLLYIEGINPSITPGDIRMTISFTSDNGTMVETDRLVMTAVGLELKVDEDRDGKIVFDNPDVPESKYIFWVNDDFDKEIHEEGEWHEDDKIDHYAIPVDEQDWNDEYIGQSDQPGVNGNKRDLEDFAMIQLRVPREIYELPGLTYSFKFANVVAEEGNQPSINLFKAVSELNEYLSIESEANIQIKEKKLLTITADVETKIANEDIFSDGEITSFIFEACNKGSGDLKFLVKKDGLVLFETSVRLELHDIRWFYDEFKVDIASGSTWDAEVDTTYQHVNQAGYSGESNEYFLFVHGWNVNDAEKKRWAETIFKRLWWQGYKGGVGIFNWPCLTWPDWDPLKLADPENFNNSEFLSWQSSNTLSQLFQDLKGGKGKKIGVLAHSQGNVVTGEALARYPDGAPRVDSYIATQAAISTSLYDNRDVIDRAAINFSILGNVEIKNPRIYEHYYTGQDSDEPYFHQPGRRVEDHVDKMWNFYNKEDFALKKSSWELNNILKPCYQFRYLNRDDNMDIFDETQDAFVRYQLVNCGKDEPCLEPVNLSLNQDRDRYQIFSYIASSRTRALGTQNVEGGFDGNIDLKNEIFGFDKEHYSHSRQFRSNIVRERPYWLGILKICEF